MMRRSYPALLAAAAGALFAAVLGNPAVARAQSSNQPQMSFTPAQTTKKSKKPAKKSGSTSSGSSGNSMTITPKQAGQSANANANANANAKPAAQPEPQPEPEPEPEPEPGSSGVKSASTAKLAKTHVSWNDILVVVRKSFLKKHRLEVLPMWGVTMNDNIIRHFQLGAQLNYYLTDVLAVGIEGAIYQKDLREPFDLVARQARRLPTVNKYNYEAALNFHYVPIYGKFAILDQHIWHWEAFFTAGIGFTQSEVLPRDPALQPFKNFLVTPNVGMAMRFFLNKFLTVNVGIRDYIFVDKFEAPDRTEVSAAAAKANATSSLINNVLFQAGLSFWFPTSFHYTTFR